MNSLAVVAALFISSFSPSLGWCAESCVVADPTGTPLNIRSFPQGTIQSTATNGTMVGIINRKVDHLGKVWAEIATPSHGFVIASYLNCGGNTQAGHSVDKYTAVGGGMRLSCSGTTEVVNTKIQPMSHFASTYYVFIDFKSRVLQLREPGQDSQNYRVQDLSDHRIFAEWKNNSGWSFTLDRDSGKFTREYELRDTDGSAMFFGTTTGSCRKVYSEPKPAL